MDIDENALNKTSKTKIANTKMKIRDALLNLLETKEISRIFIKELCAEAGINRTTFYKYYGSQYDVLNEISNEFILNTSQIIMQNLDQGVSIREALISALDYMLANIRFTNLLMSRGHGDLLSYTNVSLPSFVDYIIIGQNKTIPLNEQRAVSTYIIYGVLFMLRDWISNPERITAEEEVSIIMNTVGRTLGK